MELLTPFTEYIKTTKLSEKDVIKLGCDICSALEMCEKKGIIHRDIKPENIFINEFGYFKLGDFGIARTMDNMSGGMSSKGTPFYMAPEVFNSTRYDSKVDIYSLGLVMYKQMNNDLLPFIENKDQLLNPTSRATALDKRRTGEEIAPPSEASVEMANIILKACAFEPSLRFANATEMKNALISLQNGTYKIVSINFVNEEKTTSVRKNIEKTIKANEQDSMEKHQKAINKKMIAIIAVSIVLIIIIIFSLSKCGGDNVNESGDSSENSETMTSVSAEDAEIAGIILEADSLVAEKNFDSALLKIQNGLKKYPASEKLLEKETEIKNIKNESSIQKILEEAQMFVDIDDYENAVNKIKDGLQKYPDSVLLKTKETEYTNA